MICLLTNDLMFQSKVSGAVRSAGKPFLVERDISRLAERAAPAEEVEMILIDLSYNAIQLSTAVPQLRSHFPQTQLIAFGPHVDVDRLAEAEESGVDVVMTRGQFDRDLMSLVSS
jgi:DNA-binding NarL/FixJ family response regulator